MKMTKNQVLLLNIVGAALALALQLACTNAQMAGAVVPMAGTAAAIGALSNPNPPAVIVVPAQ